jgi:isoquinoline 1-oxidoreductase beta subunit
MDGMMNRRALLGGTALVIGLHLARDARGQAAGQAAGTGAASAFPAQAGTGGVFAPNAFIRIAADDSVTVLDKHLEMGQGNMTGLATIVAEELDADWAQMRAEHAPSDPDLYKNLMFGVQGTGGSTAIANSYDQLRLAGAAARAMLLQAAARRWSVAPGELTIEAGVIRHAASNRSARFGELAEAAAQLPVPADARPKDPANFRLIGHADQPVRRLDGASKTNGTAQFTIDIQEPGLLIVMVAHPPRFGGKLARMDDSAARAVNGVVEVKPLSSGVAVYARNTWAAKKGREALRLTWDDSAAEKRGTEQILDDYRRQAATPGRTAASHGDAEAAFARAEKVVEAEFVFPYLAHAPMEPLDGYLRWDGTSAVARFGSQFQTPEHAAIAKTLGLPMERVKIETMLAGGSFGRRAQPTSHLAIEMAEAAKAIGPGRPVKLVWTREDDLMGGYYRPFVLHRMRGAISGGKVTGWTDRVVAQSILKGSAFEAMIKDGIDATSVEGSRETPYELANFHCDLHTMDGGVPVLWWRSVGHTHTGYAVECFIDELLENAGQDPVEGRLAMMDPASRAAGVLKAVAQLADWKGAGPQPSPGGDRARGVAVVESFNTFVAEIAEVSIGEEGPRVHKIWCAVDCGVAVNPDVIRAQMEGGIGYGVGHALFAEMPLVDGVPQATNFDSYRSIRIHEMPEIEVIVIPSTEKPTGVGEPGVPPAAPAIANAMARLGLGRPRRLPFVRGGVA